MPNITFEDFQELARREGLKPSERIDDPLDTRAGKTDAILADILHKLPRLADRDGIIVDIGPGCSALSLALIEHCRQQGHQLRLIDSPEMLAHLPDAPNLIKIKGRFPDIFDELVPLVGKAEVVLGYSMLHYVFEHENVWKFLDRALALLACGGCLLLGDVPNWSKRKRMQAAQGDASPAMEIRAGKIWPGGLTDFVLFGLMGRANESGFDAYLLPQPDNLPIARWRIDLLFRRPG